MFKLLGVLPVLLIVVGVPAIFIFAVTMKFYRDYQNRKYIREHKEELDKLEEEYKKIVGHNG